jgi:hypothetical protein
MSMGCRFCWNDPCLRCCAQWWVVISYRSGPWDVVLPFVLLIAQVQLFEFLRTAAPLGWWFVAFAIFSLLGGLVAFVALLRVKLENYEKELGEAIAAYCRAQKGQCIAALTIGTLALFFGALTLSIPMRRGWQLAAAAMAAASMVAALWGEERGRQALVRAIPPIDAH